MSIIGNNIFRSTLTRQLCAALRQNFNANQITVSLIQVEELF